MGMSEIMFKVMQAMSEEDLKKDIEKRVYEKYPLRKREISCAAHKQKMDNIRDLFRKRLMNEKKPEKREFNGSPGT
jgi:hypothetical protein